MRFLYKPGYNSNKDAIFWKIAKIHLISGVWCATMEKVLVLDYIFEGKYFKISISFKEKCAAARYKDDFARFVMPKCCEI